MNVVFLYLYPMDNRDTFRPFAQRWADSYCQHNAGTKHKVYVAMVNGEPDIEDYQIFDGIEPEFIQVESGGYDIGAAQEAIKQIDCDLLVTGTSRQCFIKPNWLVPMVEARKEHGDGLFAAMASLETNSLIPGVWPNPHLRTAFYGFTPSTMRRYPYRILNREHAYLFESGEWNVSNWYSDIGLPVRQVTWTGTYVKEEWHKVPGRFRHEQQQAILIADKHTQAWAEADPEVKKLWAKRAWG